MLTELTVSIVAAFVQHQRIEAGAIPDLIVAVHRTLGDIRAAGVLTSDPDVPPQAAVSVRKSLADPEWIVSMIDGKRYRMLKRHIGMHGLTLMPIAPVTGCRPPIQWSRPPMPRTVVRWRKNRAWPQGGEPAARRNHAHAHAHARLASRSPQAARATEKGDRLTRRGLHEAGLRSCHRDAMTWSSGQKWEPVFAKDDARTNPGSSCVTPTIA
jgi:hypothetical protein